LLPGLPATPAPLFVLDWANAIVKASIARSTIAIVLRMVFSAFGHVAMNALHPGNEAGASSFLPRPTKVSVAAF